MTTPAEDAMTALPSRSRWALTLPLLAGMAQLLVAASAGAAEQRQTADTVVVVSGPPRYAAEGTLVTELEVGASPAPGAVQFGTIADIAMLPDGGAYILDSSSPPTISRIDASGALVRYIGRRGQGPGEYGSVGGIALLPDGGLAVLDVPQRRILIFKEDGTSTATWSLGVTATMSVGSSRQLQADPQGRLVLRASVNTNRGMEARPLLQPAVFVFSLEGRLLDSTIVARVDASGDTWTPSGGGVASVQPIVAGSPYNPRWLHAVGRDGTVLTGFPDRYAFELQRGASTSLLWKPGGRVVSVRRPDVRPIELGAEERRDLAEFLAARSGGRGATGSGVRYKPFYRRLMLADDGRVWVDVFVRSEQTSQTGASNVLRPIAGWHSPVVYDMFEPNGAYVGRVRFPDNAVPVVASGDVVWAQRFLEDGTPVVARMRIQWPASRDPIEVPAGPAMQTRQR